MKIFISGINTQLGYHLTQTLRQDHILLEGYSLISGTLSDSQQYTIHQSVYQTFNYSEQRDYAVKNAVQSDVIIFDIRNQVPVEVQFILKTLKHYKVKKSTKVIGISNYMTWSNTKSSDFNNLPIDKDQLLQYTLNKQNWHNKALIKQHYGLRVAHPMFVYNYLLQQQIMNLRHHNKFIEPKILCTGLLYGKSGFDFKQFLQNGLNCKDNQLLTLRNDKQINQQINTPVLHVDKLLDVIQQLTYNNKQKDTSSIYKVLQQDQTKPIIKVIESINQLSGNMKQINEYRKDKKQEKQVQRVSGNQNSLNVNHLNTNNLNPNTLNLNSMNALTNQNSTRSVTPSILTLNRNSSQNTSVSLQPITNTLIPELRYANNKRLLSYLTNIKFSNKQQIDTIRQEKQLKNQDDTLIDKTSQRSSDLGDSMIKSLNKTQAQVDKNWVLIMVNQFLEYYDVQFKRFIISQEVLHQITSNQEINPKLTQALVNKYTLINKQYLSNLLNQLLQSGQISQQRLTTPQQDKKKPAKTNNNQANKQNRQSLKKQPYQICFPQLIQHLFTNNQNSNYLICLKHQLIQRMLNLMKQTGFQQCQNLQFINISGKQTRPNTPNQRNYQSHSNIQKSVQILSDEFYTLFGLQDMKPSHFYIKGQAIQFQDGHEYQKSKKKIQPSKQSQEDQQIKINLLSQYLLDNLVVYLAEAKQQLKLKGKWNFGQKFEGKANIKLFIEELKAIRNRQQILANQQEQQEGY